MTDYSRLARLTAGAYSEGHQDGLTGAPPRASLTNGHPDVDAAYWDGHEAGRTARPVLLIDVDGVLNVHPGPNRSVGAWEEHDATSPRGKSFRLHLNPTHGEWLNTLADLYDFAWATTWNEVASTTIGPLIGLPTGLPWVPIPNPHNSDAPLHGSFKTLWVARWLAGRSVAWIDDDIGQHDERSLVTPSRSRVPKPHSKRALAIGIDPDVGLTWEHIERLREWAGEIR